MGVYHVHETCRAMGQSHRSDRPMAGGTKKLDEKLTSVRDERTQDGEVK